MDMGLTKGTTVYIRKVAPLGDPIELTVRGSKAILLSFTCRIIFPPTSLTTVTVSSTTNPSSAIWYQKICEEYGCTAKVYTKEKGAMKKKIGSPDLFSKPTVSVAMKKFRENGFVTMDSDGQIELAR